MFTIAGILADEEPKTAISPNGLYNTSVVSSDAVFSSTLLEGLSDFTIMNWFYLDPVDVNNFYTQSYFEFGSGITLNPIRVFEDKIEVSISNSNGVLLFYRILTQLLLINGFMLPLLAQLLRVLLSYI